MSRVRVQMVWVGGGEEWRFKRLRKAQSPDLGKGPVFRLKEKDVDKIMKAQKSWDRGNPDPWFNLYDNGLEQIIPEVVCDAMERRAGVY